MPVYEFYCPDCHMIFNFLSRRVNVRKRPACPRCDRSRLERKVSLFSISKGIEESDTGPMADMSEADMERALESLAGEFEGVDEGSPRDMARMMRRLYETSGLKFGPGMEEAVRRMEAGEDPDTIEAEMEDLLEGEEDEFIVDGGPKSTLRNLRRKILPPATDENLYDM